MGCVGDAQRFLQASVIIACANRCLLPTPVPLSWDTALWVKVTAAGNPLPGNPGLLPCGLSGPPSALA